MYNTKKGRKKNKPKTAVMYDTKNTIHNIVFFSLYIGSWIYKTILHKKLWFFLLFLFIYFLPFDLHHESEQPALSQIEKRPDYSGLLGDDHIVTVALLVQARIQNKSMFGTCTDVTKSRATLWSALKFSDSHFTEKQAAVWWSFFSFSFLFLVTVKAWISHTAWLIDYRLPLFEIHTDVCGVFLFFFFNQWYKIFCVILMCVSISRY